MIQPEKSQVKTKNIAVNAYLDTVEEINKKYKNDKDRKIAAKCLGLCHDWAINIGIESMRQMSSDITKKQCKSYVNKNFKKDDVGSILISILLSIAIKFIIEWVINKFLEKLKTRIEQS